MRRALSIVAVLALLAGVWTLTSGAGDDDGGRVKYRIELDNAFGLIEGADLKIAGVRAGRIDEMTLDRTDMRAVIDVSVDREGFGDLRRDATCETRPQSLIGEYFIDCKPGTAREKLEDGGIVPVQQTLSTVPVDLVNNIMRRPYRERWSIILSELGAALAARGPDLNETIRRASPALRETDRVLAILREQRRTIRDLYRDADRVVGALAGNRDDVNRFVAEARDTAAVGAARPAAVRRQLRALPPFLSELQETMPLLGEAARRQTGAISKLRANAPLLREFLDTLRPFADASRPATRTLGAAAREGRPAVIAARPRLRELGRAAKSLPELGQNLAITLEHLDDRKYAVEKDARSPGGGAGYTGLEALLRYFFSQSQAVNLFDGNGYVLKLAAFLNPDCASYQNAESAKAERQQKCAAILGPNRPGINQPDPSGARTQARARRKPAPARSERPAAPAPSAPGAQEQRPAAPQTDRLPVLPDVLPEVQKLLEDLLPDIGSEPGKLDDLLPGLDFLLAP